MRRILFLATAMLMTLSISAQLLYKVTGKDLKEPSYFMGTMHIADSSFVDKVPGLRRAMHETKQVYGEVLLSDGTGSINSELPEGQTLKTILSQEQFDKLNVLIQKIMGLPLTDERLWGHFATSSPMDLEMQLELFAYVKQHDMHLKLDMILDSYMQQQAKDAGKPVGALETGEYLDSLIKPKPMEKQIKDLMCFVENPDWNLEMLDRVVQAYYSQDIQAIAASDEDTLEGCDDTDDDEEEEAVLLGERNKHWMEQIPGIMRSSSTLFAVGVGHLHGEYSLLDQLRKLGYTVEAVAEDGQILVVDAQDGTPLQGAFVYDEKGLCIGNTDSKGIARCSGRVKVSFISYETQSVNTAEHNGPVRLVPVDVTLKTVTVDAPAFRKQTVAERDVFFNNDKVVLYREAIIDYYTDLKTGKMKRVLRACRQLEHPKIRRFATLEVDVRTTRTIDLRRVGTVHTTGVESESGDTVHYMAEVKGHERKGVMSVYDEKRDLYHCYIDQFQLRDNQQSRFNKMFKETEMANIVHWTYAGRKPSHSGLVACRLYTKYLHCLTDSIMEESTREIMVLETSTMTKEQAKAEMKNKDVATDFTLPASMPSPAFNVKEQTQNLVEREFWER